MATILLPNDFKEFLRLLHVHGVEYMLVGGYAVMYHGYPRSTGDMDVWFAVNPSNAAKLADALHAFGFSGAVTAETLLQPGKIFRMGRPPLRIELLTAPSGVVFEECYPRSRAVVIDGVEVRVISLEDLKANKRAAGRSKDLADLENLP